MRPIASTLLTSIHPSVGTRNQRLRGKELDSEWSSLLGRKIQLVTLDGITFTGKVVKLQQDQITVVDPGASWYNRKKHSHIVPRNSIQEVILDLIRPY